MPFDSLRVATESLMPVIEHSRHPTLCVGEPIDKVFVSMDHLRATEELLAEEKYLLAVKVTTPSSPTLLRFVASFEFI